MKLQAVTGLSFTWIARENLTCFKKQKQNG